MQFKANAPDGFNIIFAICFTQFFPQVADMDFQGTFRTIGRFFADAVEQDGFCNDLRLILHQDF